MASTAVTTSICMNMRVDSATPPIADSTAMRTIVVNATTPATDPMMATQPRAPCFTNHASARPPKP